MGWKRKHYGDVFEWELPDGKIRFTNTFCPSTDIAAAWEVVEKTGLLSYGVVLTYNRKNLTWEVSDITDAPQINVLVEADTAPQAICLAALKAMSQ